MTTVAIAEGQGATVIRNARNEGYGRANNIGGAGRGQEFLLIVNPDVRRRSRRGRGARRCGAALSRRGLFAPQIVEPIGPRVLPAALAARAHR